MSEDPFDSPPPSPAPPRVLGDKDVHVPGAGTMGMGLLVASLSMIFGATIVLFVIFRILQPAAWRTSAVHLPATIWLSTVLIVVSSFTMQAALRAVRRDDEASLTRNLTVTLAIGVVFLILQIVNWYQVYAQIVALSAKRSWFLVFFYLLTATHAAHVIGGLIPMGVTLQKARRGVYSRNFYPGVRHCAIYWHFLDIVWVILFVLMVAA